MQLFTETNTPDTTVINLEPKKKTPALSKHTVNVSVNIRYFLCLQFEFSV